MQLHTCGVLDDITHVAMEGTSEWLLYADAFKADTKEPNKPLKTASPSPTIDFNCPHCGIGISADLQEGGTTTNCPKCEGDVVVPQQPTQASSTTSSQAKPLWPPQPRKAPLASIQSEVKSGGRRKRMSRPVTILLVLPLILICVGLFTRRDKFYTNNKGLTDSKSWFQTEEKVKFWKFQFGDSYAECAQIMKSIKAAGIFTTLATGSGRHWMPDATNIIRGYGNNKSNLEGTLDLPCDGVCLLFKKDKLVAIDLDYSFKHPSNHVDLPTRDMERIFQAKAVFEETEDAVGNSERKITINKGGIGVKITDEVNERVAPTTHIFVIPRG